MRPKRTSTWMSVALLRCNCLKTGSGTYFWSWVDHAQSQKVQRAANVKVSGGVHTIGRICVRVRKKRFTW